MMKAPRIYSCIQFSLILLLTSGCVIRVESPAERFEPEIKSSFVQIPTPDTEGMSAYERHKLFASRYIVEGDYQSALDELYRARDMRQDDPELYERLGVAYDGDRQSGAAYENFFRAAEMYLASGDIGRAQSMHGWLRIFPQYSQDPNAPGLAARLKR